MRKYRRVCENCKKHEDCKCLICASGTTVICAVTHKHVDKTNVCGLFERKED